MGHTYVGTEHIILGFMQEGKNVAASVLKANNITLNNLYDQMILFIGKGEKTHLNYDNFTPALRRILNGASAVAKDVYKRQLDPLDTNLVVADENRTEKTICLAVTPSLKSYGLPGRARLFEVVQKVNEINRERFKRNNYKKFSGESCLASELENDMSLQMNYVVARPQMAHYIKISTDIYKIYLRYIAPEDIHVYSVDEVFMDITGYLKTYKCSPYEDVYKRQPWSWSGNQNYRRT